MAKIGTVACLACGQAIPVKTTGGGGVSVCCPWCDLSAYAKGGTDAAKLIGGRMAPDAKPEPEPAKSAAKSAPVKPAAPEVKPAMFAGTLLG